MTNIKRILFDTFGYQTFRPGQEEVIQKIFQKENVLGIMPTGSGKSICYQLPSLVLSGVTIVISPLISLMKDQVDAANLLGIRASFINSSLSYQEIKQRLSEVEAQQVQLLYVAPERFIMEEFQSLLRQIPIACIAVDEAHCISQWGHDFRPSYLEMAHTINQLTSQPVVVALTATATPQVAQDIHQLLKIPVENQVSTGFARDNLNFKVIKDQNKNQYLLEYLRMNQGQAGIIYASTRKEVERLFLLLEANGIAVGKYHGGLNEKERNFYQEAFLFDRLSVMVATNAFGMGINKSNVRFVIHAQVPGTMEAYYQEAGRAGRDGLASDAILLYAPQDLQVQQFFIDQSEKTDERKQQDYLKLREFTQYANTEGCLQRFILNYFGQDGVDCQHCSNCLDQRVTTDVTLEAQKVLSCIKRMNEGFGKNLVVKVLSGSQDKKVKEMHFETLSTFGIMKESTQKEIASFIDFLLASNFLQQTSTQFPTIKVTPLGINVLKGNEKVYRKENLQVTALEDSDELFEVLRQLRTRLADEEQVPAYIIFSDATLKELSEKQPASRLDLLDIKGIGQNKLDKYGAELLTTIETFVDNSDNAG